MVADPVATLAARTARVARTWSPAALTVHPNFLARCRKLHLRTGTVPVRR